MPPQQPYLFQSARLGFRCWQEEDILAMAEINADPEVMRYFPSTQNETETRAFVLRMQSLYAQKGYCYFALETLADAELIGFTGLAEKDFLADSKPCVDIGWRLKKKAWHKGYATEAALACLHYAFEHLELSNIIAIAPEVNSPSINVMKKIGMQPFEVFLHPHLEEYPALQTCVRYHISKSEQAKK